MTLEAKLKAKACELGFDLVGITTPDRPGTYQAFCDWLRAGHAGEMAYLESQAAARGDPESIVAGVHSIVMVAISYHRGPQAPAAGACGRVASYAQGRDYHDVLWRKLDHLLAYVQREAPGCKGRGVVDTAPLLERDLARRAGLGWFGKNTMLIHPQLGSFYFLGALLLSLRLAADEPFQGEHCGTCTACLEACPTQAFPRPGILDSRRCISYLTIELKGPIPPELRSGLGDWIFGCDVCQDVCPWNHKATLGREPAFAAQANLASPDLGELLTLSPAEFRKRFGATALARPKRRGLLRNACIALGNLGDPKATPALIQALDDDEPLIRGAAAWALGRLATATGLAAVRQRLAVESDEMVRRELDAALALMK
jgi:epoxyqueuosine reductase